MRRIDTKISLIRLITSLLGATIPTATVAASCNTYYCDKIVLKTLYVDSNGNAFVATDTPISSLNCTPNGSYLMLPHATGSEEIYSLLLMAHQQLTPISIRINIGSNGCTINYVVSEK